jgi:predicted nucleotidyltransferase
METPIKIVIEALVNIVPDLKGVYLFGSRADGSARPDSDFDFAFLNTGTRLSDLAVHSLRLALATSLDADVDLVDLRAASTVLQFQIISKGRRIYSSDDSFCDTFDLFVYSSYQHLNEGQQEIIQAIRQRGKVYA